MDLKYAWRILRRNPAFAVTAIATIVLAIAANTVAFSLIHSIVMKPLPYPDSDRIVVISGGSTIGRLEELKAAARSYTEIGAYMGNLGTAAITGDGTPEVITRASVSANFLEILRVQPLLGRSFSREDDVEKAAPVVMIAEQFWQRRFNGDPLIIGKSAILSGTPHTIIGVLPKNFAFPSNRADAWVTNRLPTTGPASSPAFNSPILTVFGRLKPGVDLEQASAELREFHQRYVATHAGMLDAKPDSVERVIQLKDRVLGNIGNTLWLLSAAVASVLLIGCANIAGLLLARASSRSQEFAARMALGAGRWRVIRQLLTESVLLSFIGGGIGVLLARWSLDGITGLTSLNLPRAAEIRMDPLVIGFAILVSAATGVLFGLLPALTLSRPDLANALRTSGATTRSRAGSRMRNLLVAGQVALSIVLLVGATLLIESLARVYAVDPGFNTKNLLTMQISLPASRYNTAEKKAAFFDELVRRVKSLPRIDSAAVSMTLPMMGFARTPVQVAGRTPFLLNERPFATLQNITSEYFRTMQIAIKRGREFNSGDGVTTAPVVLINESLARTFWPEYPEGPDPIGERLLVGSNLQPAEIVGVAANILQGLEAEPQPAVYRVYAQNPAAVTFAVRTNGEPQQFVRPIRAEVLAIDPDQPISAVRTMEELVDASQAQRTLLMRLLGVFSGLAVILTLIGIYGTLAYSVTQRKREVGLRIALGTHRRDIIRLLLREGITITTSGAAVGLVAAFGFTRLLKAFLFGITPTDPSVFAGVAFLFTVIALAACYLPIRHAARIDPAITLRHE